MRVRLIALAVAGGLCTAPLARAGEPALTVRVSDSVSGDALPHLQCSLIEPARKLVRARFRGAIYRGAEKPRAGDELWIYHRGHDLKRVRLLAGQREVETTLVPTAERCRIVLRGKPAASIHVYFQSPRAYQPRPVDDEFPAVVGADGLELPVPRGVRTFAVVNDDQRLIWPRAFSLVAGAVHELTIDPPRRLAVRHDSEPKRFNAFRGLPDLLWTPPGPAARVDAWRLDVTLSWPAPTLDVDAVSVSPDAPFHLFARAGKDALYRYVRRRDAFLDLRSPFPSKIVARRPIVNGVSVAPDTILAPGRLDLLAVSQVSDRASNLEGCFHLVQDEEWPVVRLPAADWLTAWSPARGLAHLRWEKGATPVGAAYPGELTVMLPDGCTATGHVSVYPDWKGTDEWRQVPRDALLRRRFDGRRSIRFRGLRPAHYGISIQIALTEERTGRATDLSQMRAIDVTLKKLTPVYRVSTRGRE